MVVAYIILCCLEKLCSKNICQEGVQYMHRGLNNHVVKTAKQDTIILRMAKTAQWLQAILDYMKKVMLRIYINCVWQVSLTQQLI